MARPSPHRHERDRAHVCPAADPAAAQERPSATRDQSQGRFDRDNLGNAQDKRARRRAMRSPDRGSGVRDDVPVRGSAGRNSARQDDKGAEEGDAGISFPLPINPDQRGVGASSNGGGVAATGGTLAQTADGVRSRRSNKERRDRGAWLLRGSQDVSGPRTRCNGGYGDAAA